MSDHGLTAATKTYLAEKDVVIYNMLKIDFVAPMLYTDAPFDIEHGGETYLSHGAIKQFPVIKETADIQANTLNIDFSGVEISAHAATLVNYKNKQVTIYKKIMAPTPQVIVRYIGYLDTYSTSENVKKGKADIKWIAKNHWGNSQKTIGRILNDNYQQSLHAGDLGLEFSGVTDGISDWWGKKSYTKWSFSWTKPPAIVGAKIKQHAGNPLFWHTTYDWYYDWDAKTLSNERLPVAYGTTKISGVPVFRGLSGTNNEFLWVAYALCEGEIDSLVSTTIDGEDVTGTALSGNVSTSFHSGTDTQAAASSLILAFIGRWSSAHQLKGIAYVVVRYEFDSDLFGGEPVPEFIIKAKKVYDPRSTLTVWSDNNALILADYMISDIYGNSIPLALLGNIDASADICDEQVGDYSGGGLIDRYRFNGVIDTNKSLISNVKVMRLTMFADIPWIDGVYIIRLEAETKTPVYTFDKTNLKGNVEVKDAPIASYANKIIYKYTDVDQGYISSSIVEESATFLAEDAGIVLEKTVSNAFETSAYRATNLAKTALKRSRQQLAIEIEAAHVDAMSIEVADAVIIDLESKGWGLKEFKVLSVDTDKLNEMKLSLIEHEPTVYDWTVGTQISIPNAPDMQSPFTIYAPTNLQLYSGDGYFIQGYDGSIIPRIYGTFTASVDAYVVYYDILSKLVSETNYIKYAEVSAKDAKEFYISPVESTVDYDVQVIAVSSSGLRATPLHLSHTSADKLIRPDDVTGLLATETVNSIILSWNAVSNTDLKHYLVREGQVWATGTNEVTVKSTTDTRFITTDGLKYYMVKAVNNSEIESQNPDFLTFDATLPAGGSVTLTSGNAVVAFNNDGTVIDRLKVTWSKPVVVDATVAGYRIWFHKGSETIQVKTEINDPDTLEYYFTEVEVGATYTVYVETIGTLLANANFASDTHVVLAYTGVPANVTVFDAVNEYNNILLTWDEVANKDIRYYIIKEGTVWSTGTNERHVQGSAYRMNPSSTGTKSYMIKAYNSSQRESVGHKAASLAVPITNATTLTLTADQDLVADDGTTKARIKVGWTISADTNVNGYELRWMDVGSSEYTYGQPINDRTTNQTFIDVLIDIEYQIEIRAFSALGLFSNWLTGTRIATGAAIIGKGYNLKGTDNINGDYYFWHTIFESLDMLSIGSGVTKANNNNGILIPSGSVGTYSGAYKWMYNDITRVLSWGSVRIFRFSCEFRRTTGTSCTIIVGAGFIADFLGFKAVWNSGTNRFDIYNHAYNLPTTYNSAVKKSVGSTVVVDFEIVTFPSTNIVHFYIDGVQSIDNIGTAFPTSAEEVVFFVTNSGVNDEFEVEIDEFMMLQDI